MLAFYTPLIADETEQDKFTAIYEAYYPLMLKIAESVLHDPARAEDAVQETFLYILKVLPNIGEPESPRTKALVCKSVSHAALDICRSRKREQKVVQDLPEDLPGPEDIAARLERQDRMSRLKRYILELPAEEREMLELFYFSKLKAQDIGALYHISTKTVYNRLHAITNKLQQRMKGDEQIG